MQRGSLRRHGWRSDEGSNVAQAAAVAILAALLIGALQLGGRGLVPGVERAFGCVIASLGGGTLTCAGSATETGSGDPQNPIAARPISDEPCPTLPNAGYLDNDQPTDLASLYRMITRQYQQRFQTPDTQNGPVGITRIGDNRYMVTLVGIEPEDGKYNRFPNAVRDEIGIESQYHAHVRDLIAAQIPPGAEIVLAGHSHGGIVGQNIARDDRVAEQYNVTHVITYGSPVSGPPRDGVDYKMFEITGDIVPGAAITHLPSFFALLNRGDYHMIPADRWYWNPLEYHSRYAEALEKLARDPANRDLVDLPFAIDRWDRTETFHANAKATDDLNTNCR